MYEIVWIYLIAFALAISNLFTIVSVNPFIVVPLFPVMVIKKLWNFKLKFSVEMGESFKYPDTEMCNTHFYND